MTTTTTPAERPRPSGRQALHLRVGRRPRRRRCDDARPARWQGRRPRRDDQRRPARSARFHDHDRGVQRLLRRRRAAARTGSGRTSWTRSRRSSGAPARASATRRTRSSCRVRSGRQVLDARDDGHGPQPRASTRRRSSGLVALTGNERFGWDAYRRFIQMFGRIVMDVKGERFDEALEAAKQARGVDAGHRPRRPTTCATLAEEFKRDRPRGHRPRFPERPATSSSTSRSRPSSRAGSASARVDYRNNQKIAHDLGTAVNVVTMVFGNMGDDSGTGVAFTRDPNTGEKALFGEYLTNAQGEDVVAGIRTAPKISQMHDRHARGLRRVPAHRPSSSSATTATSRTSSSRSSAASSTCSRRARPSGPRPRP